MNEHISKIVFGDNKIYAINFKLQSLYEYQLALITIKWTMIRMFQ